MLQSICNSLCYNLENHITQTNGSEIFWRGGVLALWDEYNIGSVDSISWAIVI